MDSKPMTTAQVPVEYLKAVQLVGSVPLKALHKDQRISYTLYVPSEHYNPDPKRRLRSECKEILDPVYQLPRLPLLVNVHGTGRSVGKCRDQLIPFADSERVAILAPLYPAGIDSYNDLDSYKLLRYKSLRSDLALLDILEEVAVRWPGIATEKVFLMGFSGGGQFSHRFMYLFPERLHAVSVGAPGSVTLLDGESDWPTGIKNLEEVLGEGTKVERERIRALLGIQLVVGDADNFVYGGDGFWEWLKGTQKGEKSDGAAPAKVTGRLETIKNLRTTWQKDGIVSRLDVVEGGVGHESDKILATVLGFFRPLVREIQR
ncbi:hypothetical protein B7494_g7320 [Chlorociboria aeruginascens]|nr:hypothetical protein B7494_g7320 [Chlorociboria aeruginascens]